MIDMNKVMRGDYLRVVYTTWSTYIVKVIRINENSVEYTFVECVNDESGDPFKIGSTGHDINPNLFFYANDYMIKKEIKEWLDENK